MSWKQAFREQEMQNVCTVLRINSEANNLMAWNEAIQQLWALSIIDRVERLLSKIVRQLLITEHLAWLVI